LPLLSVVVPTHNRAARLQRALESLQAQTVGDLEVVVVDDGSTDSTPSLVADVQARDPRIRYARLDGGSGAAKARNEGIGLATGEFLAFLDDDDEWHPKKGEIQIDFLRAHPAVGIVGCDYVMTNESAGSSATYRGPKALSPFALLWVNVMMGCSFPLLRRGAFSFEPRFDPGMVPAEDWDLWLRCSDEREISWLDSVLCRYVIHGPQLTGDRGRRFHGDSAFFAKHEGRMPEPVKAFHRAALMMLEHGEAGARMRARARILATTPVSVSAVMARLSVSSKIGRVLSDPGRPVRTLVRAVRRFERMQTR
jgi:glycosyltransferase involved in cell wall biosynthesis